MTPPSPDNPFPSSDNPFRPPGSLPLDERISHDPSIEHEPHLRQNAFMPTDEAELVAERELAASIESPSDRVDHSVWEEPALSAEVVGGPPADGVTYGAWLSQRMAQTRPSLSWWITAGIAALSGLFAVVGTLLRGGGGFGLGGGLIMVCLVGPLTEEIMKAALSMWVVEKRPYLFQSAWQIALTAAASGLMFAVVENLLYLNVYIPNPQPGLVAWRWTACVALHVICTSVAGLGLIRVWQDCVQHGRRPQLTRASAFLASAVAIHSAYNTLAVLSSLLGA